MARALELAQPLPDNPFVIDLGCGPGLAAVELAAMLPGASILGVDLHQPFVDNLNALASDRDLAQRLRGVVGDMASPPARDCGFDLNWSEGAAYSIGFENALSTWRPLLAPGGRFAASEAVWLPAALGHRGNEKAVPGDHVPDVVLANWEEYPDLTDRAGCLERIDRAGYRLLGDFTLPEDVWWTHYYGPMEERIREVRDLYATNPEALAVVDNCQSEIDVYREHSDLFGYQFFVLEPRSVQPFSKRLKSSLHNSFSF